MFCLDKTLVLTENSKGLLKLTNQLGKASTEDQESKIWSLEEIPGWKSQFSRLKGYAQDHDHQATKYHQEEAIQVEAELQEAAAVAH